MFRRPRTVADRERRLPLIYAVLLFTAPSYGCEIELTAEEFMDVAALAQP
jgi:hypothetical protein